MRQWSNGLWDTIAPCGVFGSMDGKRWGYIPNMCEYTPLEQSLSPDLNAALLGRALVFCLTSDFPLKHFLCASVQNLSSSECAFSVKALFLQISPESQLTKFRFPLLPWAKYTSRCHGIPLSIVPLSAKIAGTL